LRISNIGIGDYIVAHQYNTGYRSGMEQFNQWFLFQIAIHLYKNLRECFADILFSQSLLNFVQGMLEDLFSSLPVAIVGGKECRAIALSI
jgi:hypothetical protein